MASSGFQIVLDLELYSLWIFNLIQRLLGTLFRANSIISSFFALFIVCRQAIAIRSLSYAFLCPREDSRRVKEKLVSGLAAVLLAGL